MGLAPHLDPQVVSTQRNVYREEFVGSQLSDLANWTIVPGTGQAVAITATNGAPQLQIDSGTAVGETVATHTKPIHLPCRIMFNVTVSQRIANQEVYLELVDTVDQTHVVRFLLDGTTNTTCKADTTNAGQSATGPVSGGNYGAIASSSPLLYRFEVRADEVSFFTITPNTNGILSTHTTRHTDLPDPNRTYNVRIRVKNLAVVTNTTVTIRHVLIHELTESEVSILAGAGVSGSGWSLPTYSTGGTFNVMDTTIWYDDSTTALGSAATYTGTSRDLLAVAGNSTSASPWREFAVSVFADQAGTLSIEVSKDGTTWRPAPANECPAVAVSANTSGCARLRSGPWRYARGKYVNGGVAQGTFQMVSSVMRIAA